MKPPSGLIYRLAYVRNPCDRSFFGGCIYDASRRRFDASACHLDFDLARLGSFPLRKRDAEDAVFVAGGDLLRVESVGNGEAAGELAVVALAAVEAACALAEGVEVALTGDGKCLILHANIDVFEVDAGEIGDEDEVIFVLEDVDRRRPGPIGLGLGEDAGKGVLESAKVGEGIELGERYCDSSSLKLRFREAACLT